MSNWRRLSDSEAIYLGLDIRERSPSEIHGKPKYPLSDEQIESVLKFRGLKDSDFKEVKRTLNDKGEKISSVEKREQNKLIDIPEDHKIKRLSTNTTTGQQWVITEPSAQKSVETFDIDSIIKKHIKPVKIKKSKKKTTLTYDFDSLTYTDVHIGMDTNKYDNSMYSVEWNEQSVMGSALKMCHTLIENKKSNHIVVDELGDLLDGFNAQTTRGGHHLPQNMTNEKAFDVALSFKMHIVDKLVNYYDDLTFNNICNDNHAGSFGYFVNSAFKNIVRVKYPHVKVNNPRTFLSHYYVNDVCFVVTHGKDDMTLKFGFKPQLDPKQIEKIDQYLKHNGVYGKAKKIIFKKGDSHQCLFDMCSSDDFYYYNYPALSPSSQWVQNNFKKGRRGFVIESFKGVENDIKVKFL